MQVKVAVSENPDEDFVLCLLYGTLRTTNLQCVAVNHHLFLMTEEMHEGWRTSIFNVTLVLDGIDRLDNEVEVVTSKVWTRLPG